MPDYSSPEFQERFAEYEQAEGLNEGSILKAVQKLDTDIKRDENLQASRDLELAASSNLNPEIAAQYARHAGLEMDNGDQVKDARHVMQRMSKALVDPKLSAEAREASLQKDRESIGELTARSVKQEGPERGLFAQLQVPKGGGVVQEFTGKKLTKETKIAPSRESSISEPVAPERIPTNPIEKPSQEEIEKRVRELIARHAEKVGLKPKEVTPSESEEFRYFLNARFELNEERIAKRDDVTAADVVRFIRQRMDNFNEDPENIQAELLQGKLRVPKPIKPSLTEEIMRIYESRGIPREEVIKRFNAKYGTRP